MEQLWQNLQFLFMAINEQLSPSSCIAIVMVLLMILFVLRWQRSSEDKTVDVKPANNASYFINKEDIQAIAGDDEIATQLDLARAYIEMDQKALAKDILQHVAQHGNVLQQQVAKKLHAEL